MHMGKKLIFDYQYSKLNLCLISWQDTVSQYDQKNLNFYRMQLLKREERLMAVNFIGLFLKLIWVVSILGIIIGLVKKDMKITKIALIILVISILVFIVLQFIFIE